jgi:hypothetical protein
LEHVQANPTAGVFCYTGQNLGPENYSASMDLYHGNETYFDLWLCGMVAKDKIHQQDRAHQTTEISLPGHYWDDENNPNSSNGGPSETTIFMYDKCGGSKSSDLKTYEQPSVETQIH